MKWVKKEINGGADGIAQIRSDYPAGEKLGDVPDGYKILVPETVVPAERRIYFSSDGKWSQVKSETGALIYPNPSGKLENWVELANVRDIAPVPAPGLEGKYEVRMVFEIKRL